jgi:hypothetical protein
MLINYLSIRIYTNLGFSRTGFSLFGFDLDFGLNFRFGCENSTANRLKPVLLRRKCQHHVSGHAAIARISGIDEYHSACDDRTGSVK